MTAQFTANPGPAALGSELLELNPVAERVMSVKPVHAFDLAVGSDAVIASSDQAPLEPVQVSNQKSRMGLSRWNKRLLDTKMQDRTT